MQKKKTPENREKLLEYRRRGYSYEKSRKLIPMGKKTLQDWRKEDESFEVELDKAYAEYVTSLEDTEAIRANPFDIRESYLDALRRHVEGLRKICLHYGASYEPLVTDRPAGRSLIDFIRRQSERKR